MLNGRIHYMTHPLIKHKISMLRDENTPTSEFRRLVREISLLIGFEATQNLPLKSKHVKTPLETTNGEFVETPVLLVPILRAGLGMVDALLELMPFASTGHIG
ncbi:MAG: uracil phosphoribosyltransferase, partial [Opitutales bacterium]|nr:uracil phosphoribosyltransferase [Opitutales bacterium]